MIRKALVLTAPLAVIAAVAVMLAPATAPADTVVKCPPGTTNPHYCTKQVVCIVPNLKGKTIKQARVALRKHNCKLGKIVRRRHHNGKAGHIYKQVPRAHSRHARGQKVRVSVKKKQKHR